MIVELAERHRIQRPQARLSAHALDLDAGVDRAWGDLVREVRASGDLQAVLALQRFQLALSAFHHRPRS